MIVAKWLCEYCGARFERKRYGSQPIPRFCCLECYWAWRRETDFRSASNFKEGHVPWNKGMKGIHLHPDTEFKKGHVPQNKLPVGITRVRFYKRDERSLTWIKVADPNVWRPLAVVVWEEHHGRSFPEGFVMHRIDGDTLNDDISNLVALSRADHMDIHRTEFEEKRLENSSIATKARWQEYRESKYDTYYWQDLERWDVERSNFNAQVENQAFTSAG